MRRLMIVLALAAAGGGWYVFQKYRIEGFERLTLKPRETAGQAAAALLGSAERLEYTLVGDTVNLCQRLQQLAGKGETVASEATVKALKAAVDTVLLGAQQVKGRETPVIAYRIVCLHARSAEGQAGPRPVAPLGGGVPGVLAVGRQPVTSSSPPC